MNDHYLRYLEREHARLDAEIHEKKLRPFPRQFLIGRFKKLKLAVKDQTAAWSATGADRKAA